MWNDPGTFFLFEIKNTDSVLTAAFQSSLRPTDSDGKGLPLEHDADGASSPEAENDEDDGTTSAAAVVAGNGAAGVLGVLPPTAVVPPPTVAVPPSFDTADDVDALSDSSGRGSGQHHTRHVSGKHLNFTSAESL